MLTSITSHCNAKDSIDTMIIHDKISLKYGDTNIILSSEEAEMLVAALNSALMEMSLNERVNDES